MWQSVKYGLSENGVLVETKVDDGNGCRLVQKLKGRIIYVFFQMTACMSTIHLHTGGINLWMRIMKSKR